jgi:nitrogen-specific signal transduction histidine kinase
LGLYVVSELVEAMDGRIDLVSSPKGTRFTIHIPCTVRRNGAPLGLVPDRDEPTPLRKQG